MDEYSREAEDYRFIKDFMPDADETCGNLFSGTVLDLHTDVPYGPERQRAFGKRAPEGTQNTDDLIPESERRPIEQDESMIFHGEVFGKIEGTFAYILSLLVKEGLELWISGVFLLISSTIALALWIVVLSPAFNWFVDPHNELDRGWHDMWRRVSTFFTATLAFVVVQTASELFLATWKNSGVASYESIAYLINGLIIFYGTFSIMRRLTPAQCGRREFF